MGKQRGHRRQNFKDLAAEAARVEAHMARVRGGSQFTEPADLAEQLVISTFSDTIQPVKTLYTHDLGRRIIPEEHGAWTELLRGIGDIVIANGQPGITRIVESDGLYVPLTRTEQVQALSAGGHNLGTTLERVRGSLDSPTTDLVTAYRGIRPMFTKTTSRLLAHLESDQIRTDKGQVADRTGRIPPAPPNRWTPGPHGALALARCDNPIQDTVGASTVSLAAEIFPAGLETEVTLGPVEVIDLGRLQNRVIQFS